MKKIALITGAARRIGASIARTLHTDGYGVVLHYHESKDDADKLARSLNNLRADSAWTIRADFQLMDEVDGLIQQTLDISGRLDVLINNASDFYPTPVGSVTGHQWDELINSNLKAPFFLSQAARGALEKSRGCIVNIVDIYAKSSLKDFSVYSISKSGLYGLTQSLAKELAPSIRVNGVSPGVILWPEDGVKKAQNAQEDIIRHIPLQKKGSPDDIAKAVLFLVKEAHYITGEVIAVDGGKGLL